MVCQTVNDVSTIIPGCYAGPALVSPHHRRMVRQRGGDGSTARLNAGPAVTNNTIDGSKPAVINNDYHQRLSPMAAKIVGYGRFETDGDLNFL